MAERVDHEVSNIRELAGDFDVHHFEISLDARTALDSACAVHRRRIPGDRFGHYQVPGLLATLRPHLVFIVDELWHLPPYLRMLSACAPAVPVVAYCPLDGPLCPDDFLHELGPLSHLVLYTRHAASLVAGALERQGLDGPPISVIPHGVDTTLFHPLSADPRSRHALARQRLFPDDPALEDAFIVLNANYNQPRKRLDLTIEAFARFAAGNPREVRLYLHTAARGEDCNLIGLARKHGILDRLILTDESGRRPAVPDDRLNLIYNACDVGINTSGGEGWGLCSFEHAATGAAQIVPGHPACREIWEDAASFLPVEREFGRGSFRVLLYEVSASAAADGLSRLYGSAALLSAASQQAYLRATRPEHNWDGISQRFASLFHSELAAMRPHAPDLAPGPVMEEI
jgi:glycosyltransferase involved in cell wall biosynthesis